MSESKANYNWFLNCVAYSNLAETRNDVVSKTAIVLDLAEMYELDPRIVADHVIAKRQNREWLVSFLFPME